MREYKFKFYIEDKPSVILTLEDLIGNHDDIDGYFARVQFTGLHDKNGVEVYEDDTISFTYGIPPVKVVAQIVCRNGKYDASTTGHKPDSCELYELNEAVCGFEVIGNIYENKDLPK